MVLIDILIEITKIGKPLCIAIWVIGGGFVISIVTMFSPEIKRILKTQFNIEE